MEALYHDSPEARVTLASLPPEILGEVFVHCASQNPNSPLSLRRVSKSFHEVVNTTPRVWEHLTLRLNGKSRQDADDKARLWFERSRSCPVDVRVEIDQATSDYSSATTSESLSSTLSTYVDRVRTLDILAPSEIEARTILDSMYTGTSTTAGAQSISIRISSTTPPNLRLSSLDARFPRLPNLQRLTLTNHTISFLSFADFDHLRELSISCPIRFPPISVASIMGILRKSPLLESLFLESRMVDGPSATNSPASENPPGSDAQGTSDSDTPAGTPSLVHLPFLTRLSLRVNAIPAVLSQLLLPNLNDLHLEDLNGKRQGASRETATVLRQLLVRMELPNEYRMGKGLRVLDLVGVEIAHPALHLGLEHQVEQQQPQLSEDEATWAWCFKRMAALQELSVSKSDVGPVLEILVPAGSRSSSRSSSRSRSSARGDDVPPIPIRHADPSLDLVCPALRRCSVSTTRVPPILVDRFRACRPSVELVVNIVHDPFFQSATTGPVDFLSLYSDARPGEKEAKGGEGTTKKARVRPPFGPWLLLV